MKHRRKILLKHAQKIDCDTLVTFEPENLFYMTGFWGEAIGLLEKMGKLPLLLQNLKLEEQKMNLKIVMLLQQNVALVLFHH